MMNVQRSALGGAVDKQQRWPQLMCHTRFAALIDSWSSNDAWRNLRLIAPLGNQINVPKAPD